MTRPRAAFTLIELTAVIAIVGVLLAVLIPIESRKRSASGLAVSIQNVSVLMPAVHAYHADNAGRAPMRAAGYSNGQITTGWDTWNFGGKNSDVYRNTPFGFDEPAYTRPLNAYIGIPRLHVPNGYVSMPTLYNPGHPSLPDRASLQMPLFHSPGDVATRQRNWPNPTLTISAYDDIGTSYVENMKWWDDPSLVQLSFTARYLEGLRRTGIALGTNPNFLFIHDQTAEMAANNTQIKGEFGVLNASVVGWADGRAGYIVVTPGAFSGPGYTFLP